MGGHAATIICAAAALGVIQSESPRVSVVPFRGPDGHACARAFAEALAPSLRIVEWRSPWQRAEIIDVDGIRTSHDVLGELGTYADLARWFQVRRTANVDVWVMGTVSLGAVIAEVYDGRTGRLLALGKIRPSSGCRLAAQDRARLTAWVRRRSPSKWTPSRW